MLKINIICIGKIKEKYFTDAIAEYSKRLGAFCKFQIIELAEERIKSNAPNQAQIDEVLLAEGKRILQKISPSDYVAAMCIEGKLISSEELSKTLTNAAVIGKSTIDFIIGGHSHTFLKDAEEVENLDGELVPIMQAGCKGIEIGELKLY